MSHNLHEAPESSVGEEGAQQLKPVKKPWHRWVVALWLFLMFGIVARQMGMAIALAAGGSHPMGSVFGALLLLGVVYAVSGIVTLNKNLFVPVAGLAILLGLFQVVRLMSLLAGGWPLLNVVLFAAVYLLPLFLCAWYLLRPGFRALADRHNAYRRGADVSK